MRWKKLLERVPRWRFPDVWPTISLNLNKYERKRFISFGWSTFAERLLLLLLLLLMISFAKLKSWARKSTISIFFQEKSLQQKNKLDKKLRHTQMSSWLVVPECFCFVCHRDSDVPCGHLFFRWVFFCVCMTYNQGILRALP